MPSYSDITPTLGRGLSFAQNLPGGYDAIDVRRSALYSHREGAISTTAYLVAQRGAGANMSVDIGTAGGYCVQGDDVTEQGLYYVPAPPTTLNITVGAAHATLPRIDQIVLEARDDTYTLDGITRARVYVLEGVATAGATLTNRNGAATLPVSTARLADVLVPAASTTVTTANIKDRRQLSSGEWGLVTALPDSPVDGDICEFQTAAMAALTVPVIWRLRYVAAISKWLPISTAPITNAVVGPYTQSNVDTWEYVSHPSITVPVAGTYLCEGVAVPYPGVAAGARLGIRIGTAGDPTNWNATYCGSPSYPCGVVFSIVKTLSASDVLRFVTYVSSAVDWRDSLMSLTPLRLG